MIHLWYSNHLEKLVVALADAIHSERTDPLTPITIVVPNRNIATFLKFELARLHGIAANLDTIFVNQFFENLRPEGSEVLRREILRSLLIERIETICAADPIARPEDEEIRSYLSASLDEDDHDRRLFQLADRLAKLFEEYELSRPAMIRHWPAGTILDREPYSSTERWQRLLWLDIFGPEGWAAEHNKDAPKTTMRFGEVLRGIVDRRPVLEGPVHIFGLSYLSRLYYDAIGTLGDTSEVFIYALNPCMEYWEDVPNGWAVSRKNRFKKRREEQAALNLLTVDDALFEDEEDPPPLKLWGRPGRDNIRMLNLLTDCDFETDFADPLLDADTLLHRIQHDVLVRAPMKEPAYTYSDDTLVILQCPTVQREIEIVASEIWELIRRANEAGESLRFNDIAVIVNQSEREAYQSRIRSVFKDTYDIPHNIVDITARANRRYLEAVGLLLGIPFSRFTRAEMLRLMTHPNVLAGHPDVDPETWIRWVDQLNIFHGADHSDHTETYIDKDLYNWDQGLKRLVLGAFMSTEADQSVMIGADHYVPHEHGATDVAVSARFVRLARDLIGTSREFRQRKNSLVEWYDAVIALIQKHLVPANDEDERDHVRVMEQLNDLRNREESSNQVRYRVAYEALETAISSLEISRGHYLADGVVVSSFVPMRPIPFKVVFITGLGERQFPRSDTQSPLDLRWARPERWDNFSVRRQDEYMFLETLQSTRERLYLSYVARDSRTGEELLPSSLVRELEFMLRRHYLSKDDVEAIKRRHPLRRFDPRYFPEMFGQDGENKTIGRSVHPEALREAEALSHKEEWKKQNFASPRHDDLNGLDPKTFALFRTLLGLPTLPERKEDDDERVSVSFYMLRRFLENPLQGAAEFYLRLRRDDERDVFEIEDEAFKTPWSLRRNMLQEIFLSTWQSKETSDTRALRLEAYATRAGREELLGRAPTGLFGDAERRTHHALMDRWQLALENSAFWKLRDLEIHHFGQADAQPLPGVLHRPLRLGIPLGIDTTREVDVTGRTPAIQLKDRTVVVLSTIQPRQPSERDEVDFFEGFIAWMVMLAAGVAEVGAWRVLVVRERSHGNQVDMRDFGPVTPDAARNWLIDLLAEMLAGVHDYRMPAEAVFLNVFKRMPFDRALEKVSYRRGNPGPVRDEDRFDAPQNLDDLIDRRFDLYFSTVRRDSY